MLARIFSRAMFICCSKSGPRSSPRSRAFCASNSAFTYWSANCFLCAAGMFGFASFSNSALVTVVLQSAVAPVPADLSHSPCTVITGASAGMLLDVDCSAAGEAERVLSAGDDVDCPSAKPESSRQTDRLRSIKGFLQLQRDY